MDHSEWQRVKDLFDAALQKDARDRLAFVQEACAGDVALQAEVLSLLTSFEQADSLVGSMPVGAPGVSLGPPDTLTHPGTRVGSYQLLREVGRGGMGAVYLAERADHQYRKQVAVKLIRPEFDSREIVRRVHQERQTLAVLDHPNIVKLLDGGTTEDGLPFLVMDYVEGMPIDRYCDAHRLSTTRRVRLFLDVCAAVQHAHQSLVVHRDLKPGNILVTVDGVPKLLDFGIAKLLDPDLSPLGVVMTRTAERPMTLEYASPEQIRGEPISTKSDVYALGVVLYRLLTGRSPYVVSMASPLELERAICESEPEKPSTAVTRSETAVWEEGDDDGDHAGDHAAEAVTAPAPVTPESLSLTREGAPERLRRRLAGDLDNIVLMALRKEPQRRYASVAEFSDDLRRHLDGQPVTARKSTFLYRASKLVRRRRTETIAAVLIVTALLAGIVAARLPPLAMRTARTGVHAALRPSIAILGFRSLSGRPEDAWVSTAIAEMLTTRLAAGERIRPIAGDQVAQVKIDLSLPEADSYGSESLSRIRTHLGTDYVVTGSYLAPDNARTNITVDLRLQDALSGRTIASMAETGSAADLAGLASRAAVRLRQNLGIEVSRTDAAERPSLPSRPEAARLYAEGLARLRLFDGPAAKALFVRAAAIEPGNAVVHSALAEAWSALLYDQDARDEAKRAFELSAGLSREERLVIEGRYREITKDWARTVEVYRTLFGFFPDNLDYGLRLARGQTSAGKGREALTTVETLRRLPPPLNEDPRIDVEEAAAANALSDFKRAQAAARKAVERGRAMDAGLLVAGARLLEGVTSRSLGDVKGAQTAYEDALHLYETAGDRGGEARAISNLGMLASERGDVEGAMVRYQQALDVFREVGNAYATAALSNNIGNFLRHHGDLAGAGRMLEEALSLRREINDPRGVAESLNNLGTVRFNEGHLTAAKAAYDQSLAIRREIGDKVGIAMSLNNLAGVLVEQGELITAKATYQELIAIRRELGDRTGLAFGLHNLGEVLREQGNAAEARRSLEEALGIRLWLGEKRNAAETQLGLARTALDEGRASEAAALASTAAEEFKAERVGDSEALARSVLAAAYLEQNSLGDATRAAARAGELAGKSADPSVRMGAAIASARLSAVLGKRAEATSSLESTLKEARKGGAIRLQLESRLALGEIEAKSGNAAAGRARLAALRKDARARGFLRIEREAAKAAQHT